MKCELRWRADASATGLHAALCQRAGLPCVDAELAAAIHAPAASLSAELQAAGWPVDAALSLLLALAPDIGANRELVTRTAAKLQLPLPDGPHGPTLTRLAGAISDLEAALSRVQPALAEELPLRGGPLREQWEARGPGMLVELARLTDEHILPDSIDVVLVAPFAGGHGTAHAAQNRITFEAMLFHPHQALPETLRLAWLVSQLNADVPPLADVLAPPVAARVLPLAMIPPVLAAAEAVEIGVCDQTAISDAISLWRVKCVEADAVAGQLWQWWQAWLDDGTASWPVALAALDAMLQDA